MKITAVASTVLRVPTPRPMALEFPEHRLVVAHVHTDAGVTGLGYSLAFGGGGAESIHELSLHVAGALADGWRVEYMDWTPPDLFVDMPRPDPASGLIRIPERPGHGMALGPDAEQKYRLR